MSTNRWIAAGLIMVTAALSGGLCAVLSAPAEGEDIDVGAPPALAPGQAPPGAGGRGHPRDALADCCIALGKHP